jgi:hypothetical protein
MGRRSKYGREKEQIHCQPLQIHENIWFRRCGYRLVNGPNSDVPVKDTDCTCLGNTLAHQTVEETRVMYKTVRTSSITLMSASCCVGKSYVLYKHTVSRLCMLIPFPCPVVLLLEYINVYFESSASNFGLSFTAPTSYWYLRWFQIEQMHKHVNWINLMTYDM